MGHVSGDSASTQIAEAYFSGNYPEVKLSSQRKRELLSSLDLMGSYGPVEFYGKKGKTIFANIGRRIFNVARGARNLVRSAVGKSPLPTINPRTGKAELSASPDLAVTISRKGVEVGGVPMAPIPTLPAPADSSPVAASMFTIPGLDMEVSPMMAVVGGGLLLVMVAQLMRGNK